MLNDFDMCPFIWRMVVRQPEDCSLLLSLEEGNIFVVLIFSILPVDVRVGRTLSC